MTSRPAATPDKLGVIQPLVDLSGKTALVTGGSRGIGRAVALRLAASGAGLVLNFMRSFAEAREVASQIEELGRPCNLIQADVSLDADVTRLIAEAQAVAGHIDILINNAGINRDDLVLRMRDETWDSVLNTNLRSAFLMTRAVLRPMIHHRWGRIINMSSVVGVTGNAGQANYAAAKAGLIGLTMATAREVASRGVTVNAIAPGFIETDMTGSISDDLRRDIASRIPMGSFGQAGDVAALATFLASDAAAYITGQVVRVDGGLAMG
jgi:3-oxoacyl-[acyl-carrier protein] reductase